MSKEVSCPALLIAAAASGQGKTTVAAALARLLTRRGWRVRVFKCGPDFLDPFWHQLASGQPVHNLDLWMTGETDVRARLHAAACDADVLLVEGVMGLHDGTPSAADLARRLGLPVLAVVQASSMAQTLGAIAHGLRCYKEQTCGPLPWAGVLANGVASDGHARLLREAIDSPGHWLGHLPKSEAMRLPERHLGLVAAHELGQSEALARLDAAADLLESTALGQMGLGDWRARWLVRFDLPVQPAIAPLLAGRTVAVACDAAFAFIYAANIDTLQALGARVVFFSPLAGDALPACDAVWLPGGYPELHAAALSACAGLKLDLHQHAVARKPIWAECGGMMALFDELVTADGTAHPMWGLLPGRVTMQKKLAGLGMQAWRHVSRALGSGQAHPGFLSLAGKDVGKGEDMSRAIGAQQEAGMSAEDAATACALRGHSFHYSRCETDAPPIAHTQPAPNSARTQGEAVYACGTVRASYFHAWFASSPSAAAALFSDELPLSACVTSVRSHE